MSGIFSAVSIGLGAVAAKKVYDKLNQKPRVAAAPVAPTSENSAAAMDDSALEMQRALARGRTSTYLTGGTGLSFLGETTSKQLLGS